MTGSAGSGSQLGRPERHLTWSSRGALRCSYHRWAPLRFSLAGHGLAMVPDRARSQRRPVNTARHAGAPGRARRAPRRARRTPPTSRSCTPTCGATCPAATSCPAPGRCCSTVCDDLEAARAYLAGLGAVRRGRRHRDGRLVELPTTYDGEDLDDVARRWGMTRAEAVATHTGTEFTVAFVGLLARVRLLHRAAGGAGGAAARPAPAEGAGRARWGWRGSTPGSTRPPRPAAGGWSAAPTRVLWDADREEPALLTPGHPGAVRGGV